MPYVLCLRLCGIVTSAFDIVFLQVFKSYENKADVPKELIISHCWNCGNVGHCKGDCPHPPSGLTKGQIRRMRKFGNRRPAASIDTSAVVNASDPFGTWVRGLFAGIDVSDAEKTAVALPCIESDSRPDHDFPKGSSQSARSPPNKRKMTWLVALRGFGQTETILPWLYPYRIQ